ncbi:cell envelope biogenesis protein OmpA [Zobellella taiwanensis]|uniref:Cell envelope biogenesis protein OmpA n=1 Tax=Zobellella taiwanensis TaxID=347535 RepID=A0A2P7R2W6_9GAMM|nr:OmpA family protein [Zobellella taiwanensis]PSJ44571.1 cell envelope biogenesis protein OmpA [Zobellella taiwanensis]
MRRRGLPAPARHGELERWLVSYADYMTLVFALFVVLYALHVSRGEGRQQLSEGMQQAVQRLAGEPAGNLGHQQGLAVIGLGGEPSTPTPGQPGEAPLDPEFLALLEARLSERLQPLVDQRLISFTREEDWLVLELDGALLFASGSALLRPASEALLSALAPVLQQGNHYIRVRGYADTLPVSNELYQSNWQLSAERARAVLEWLGHNGIEPARLALEAFGSTRPLDLGRGEARRATNRRVEIAVSNREWQAPAALPSRPLATDQDDGALGVFELPSGGIRISTRQDES